MRGALGALFAIVMGRIYFAKAGAAMALLANFIGRFLDTLGRGVARGPVGLRGCNPDTVKRWEQDGYCYPPYMYNPQ